MEMESDEDYYDGYDDDGSEEEYNDYQENSQHEEQKHGENQNYEYHCFEEQFQKQQLLNQIEQLQDNFGLSFGQALYIYKDNDYNYKRSEQKTLQDYEHKLISEPEQQEECQVCFGDENLYNQSCGHKFCSDCYTQYLRTILKQGDECITKTCPMDGCKMILDSGTFKKFLNKKEYDIYVTILYNDYIQVSKFMLPCFRTNCQYVLKLFNEDLGFLDKQANLKCHCNYRFCSLCKKEPHRPVSCERLEEWNELLGGKNTDDLNEAWIKLNSKKCPNCKIDIEKNQGCMHMTCRKCRHEFCWLCMSNWRNHSSCNKYNDNNKTKSESQKKLEKYTFFSDRYLQHKKSVGLAEKRKNEILEQMEEMLKVIPSDQLRRENVEQGLELIIDCRLAITYSYALGYFIDDSKREFFEFQQGNLEQNLELLDKYVQDIDFEQYHTEIQQDFSSASKKVYQFNKDLKDLTNTIKNYFKTMLNDFEKELPQCKESEVVINLSKQKSKKSKKGKEEEQLSEEEQIKLALKLSKQTYDTDLRKESSSGRVWICKKCTFLNNNINKTCKMCASKK